MPPTSMTAAAAAANGSTHAAHAGGPATAPLGDLARPDGSPVRVLVVDDEAPLTELLSMALRYEGWEVRTAADGAGALRAAREFRPDAVVLDVMLPDMDGLEVLARLRRDTAGRAGAVPDRQGRRRGPDRRADRRRRRLRHQAVQPGGGRRPAARAAAPLRRRRRRTESLLVVGDLTLDEDSHEVSRGGDNIHLTATEFELLRYLMRNPRRVLSKAQILDRVWNYDFGGQANVVELYISYLRRRSTPAAQPMIHTRRGAGYVIKPAESP